MAHAHESQVLNAIRNITRETGYPPDADELAHALGVTPRQIHSALLGAKRDLLIRYDEAERLVWTGEL